MLILSYYLFILYPLAICQGNIGIYMFLIVYSIFDNYSNVDKKKRKYHLEAYQLCIDHVYPTSL